MIEYGPRFVMAMLTINDRRQYMPIRTLLSGVAIVLLAVPAFASEKGDKADSAGEKHVKAVSTLLVPDKCGTTEDYVDLTASFHIKADSFSDARKQFSDKVQAVEEAAKKQNAGKFEQQSLNYNISLSNHAVSDDAVSHGLYNLNGNASYRLENADVAIKLAESLKSDKFHVSVSENKFIVQCNPTE